jgi:hypothetical protein
MPTTQAGQVTITAGSNGRYFVLDNSWPQNGRRTMACYESLRDAQKSLLSATDQQSLDEGVPFSTLSSVQVV